MQTLNDDDVPIAFAANFDDSANGGNIPKKQMVLTLNTKDLKHLRELLYGKTPMDPTKVKHALHRTDEIYKKTATTTSSSSSSRVIEGKENSQNELEEEEGEEMRMNTKRKGHQQSTSSSSAGLSEGNKKRQKNSR
jgi:hypothetical protein